MEIQFVLPQRITTENAQDLNKELMAVIEGYEKPDMVIDAKNLMYISSAGLRVLLSVSKKTSSLTLINVCQEAYEIFEMTGFSSFLNIERTLKEISIDGLNLLGKGETASVYRLDNERILKLYCEGFSMSEIRKEHAKTRKAVTLGVPTMISFELVKHNNQIGAIYEIFNLSTLLDEYKSANLEERHILTKRHADLMRELLGIKLQDPIFEDFKQDILQKLESKKSSIAEKKYKIFGELLNRIPDDNNFIHGDCHMGNVMVDTENTYVIDLGISGYGNPIFAFVPICLYRLFADYFPAEAYFNKAELTAEEGYEFWKNFLREFFSTDDENLLNSLDDCIYAYCGICSVLRYDFLPSEAIEDICDKVEEIYEREDFSILFNRINEIIE